MLRRNQRGEVGPGGHVRPETHGNLAELAVARGDDAGVLQVYLRQLQRRFGVFDIRLQRAAVHNYRLQILTRHLKQGFGLLDVGAALGRAGQRRVALANGKRAVRRQILHPL